MVSRLFESFQGVFKAKASEDIQKNGNNDVITDFSQKLKTSSDTKLRKSESVEANLGLEQLLFTPLIPEASQDDESPYVSEPNSAQLSMESLPPTRISAVKALSPLSQISPLRPQTQLQGTIRMNHSKENVSPNQEPDIFNGNSQSLQEENEKQEELLNLMSQVPCQITQSGFLTFSKSFGSLPKRESKSREKFEMSKRSSSQRVLYDMSKLGVSVPRPDSNPRLRKSPSRVQYDMSKIGVSVTRPDSSPQLQKSPIRVQYDMSKIGVSIPRPDSNPQLQKSPSRVQYDQPQKSPSRVQYDMSKIGVSIPRPDSNPQLKKSPSRVQYDMSKIGVSIPRPDSNPQLQKSPSGEQYDMSKIGVSISRPDSNPQLQKSPSRGPYDMSKIGVSVPRPDSNPQLQKPPSIVQYDMSKIGVSIPRPDSNPQLQKSPSRVQYDMSKIGVSVPRPDSNPQLQKPPSIVQYDMSKFGVSVPRPDSNPQLQKSPSRGQYDMSKIGIFIPQPDSNPQLQKPPSRVLYDMSKIGVSQPNRSPQFQTPLQVANVRKNTSETSSMTEAVKDSVDSSSSMTDTISTVEEEVSKLECDTVSRSTTSHNTIYNVHVPPWHHNLPTSCRSESFEHVQSVIGNIISEEGEEFKERYSEWIAEVFYEKLDKMRKRLIAQFNSTLGQLESKKDEDIKSLHQFYQRKLSTLETSSQKFQQLIRSIEMDNRRNLQGKDELIGKLSKALGDSGQNFEHELEKQRSLIKAEVEREKTELITQQGNLDRFFGWHSGPVSQISHGDEGQDVLNVGRGQFHDAVESRLEIIALHEKIESLQKTVATVTQEKLQMAKSNQENISSIMKHSEQSIQEMTLRLQTATEKIPNLKKRHEREMKDMKMAMLNKETLYNKTFIELKRRYGDKIDGLAKVIQRMENTYS